MGAKLGRNDLCWCGSGRKYKYCHLGRAEAEPATIQEILSTTNKIHSKKYCLHPDAGIACQGGIIRAHTIQRTGGLSRIADQGHVYTFVSDLIALKRTNGQPAPRLLGFKDATTFTGFCALHDSTTFAPIETHPFTSNRQHTFLLAYRAICRELYAKAGLLDLIPYVQTLDRGRTFAEQLRIQDFSAALKIGVEQGLQDLRSYKAVYDAALQKSNFSKVHYYVIRLSSTPDFLCSGATLPEHDFQGQILQRLDSSHVDHLAFSLIATDTGGAAVFSWLGESPAGIRLVKSLNALSDVQIPHALVRFVFLSFENIAASPKWWDGLSGVVKQKLLDRLSSNGLHKGACPDDSLCDDGIRAVTWVVSGRETNLSLEAA